MDDEALIEHVLGGNDHEADLLGRRGHKQGYSEPNSDSTSLSDQDNEAHISPLPKEVTEHLGT